jgi:adenylate cyclase
LPPPDPFNRAYSDDDVAMVRAFRAPEGLFPDESEYRSILRVIGSAMASVAEAGVTAYIRGVERPLELVGAPPIAHAQAQMEAIFTYGQFAQAMPPLLRRHTMMAIRRARVTRLNSVRPGTDTYAVGFIDLVGFTPLSQQIASEDLADLVTSFEALAIDIMSDHEGRVVKLIGDEVMFVAVDPGEACEIALTLIESFDRSDHDVSPRGGLAYGEVLTREGDFFGPTVNLASRIVDQAVAGDILVTQSVHDGVKDATYSFEGAGKRMLKGFDEPVRLWAVTRGTAFPA